MRCLSSRSSDFSLGALLAAALVSAAGCGALSFGASSTGESSATGAGGGLLLTGSGGAGGTMITGASTGTGGTFTPPYLMGSYAYLCGGDTASCIPGNGVCSLIDPSKSDAGIGGNPLGTSSTASSSGSAGSGGASSGSAGSGGASSSSASSSSASSGSAGSGGASSGSAGSGGASSSSAGSGGASSSSAGSGGGGGGGPDKGTSSATGGDSDAGVPITLTCKLAPISGAAVAGCTQAGDLVVSNPCQTAGDCGVGLACVATPSGGVCRPYCCGQVEACPIDTYCAPVPMAEAAVKIPVCLPAYKCKPLDDSTCTNGQTCTIVRDDGTTSCVDPGDGSRGDACPCSAGQVCSKITNTCLKLCHIGNDAADCGAGSCQGGVMGYPDGIGICVGYP